MKNGRSRQLRSAGRRLGDAALVAACAAIVFLAVGNFVRTPYRVWSESRPVPVGSEVDIDGAMPGNGSLLVATARLRRVSLAALPFEWIRTRRSGRLERRAIDARDRLPTNFDQRRTAVASAEMAGRAAAGQSVDASGGGVIVVGRRGRSGLRVGSILMRAEKRRLHTAADLRSVLCVRGAGDTVRVVLRGGKIDALRVAAPSRGSRLRTSTREVIDTWRLVLHDRSPLVTLRNSDVGGPSLGLPVALAAYSVTSGEDILRGRRVVATGHVDVSGAVQPVAGVWVKALAAHRAGADILVVPIDNRMEVRRALADRRRPRVIGVSTVSEAVERLGGRPRSASPTC